VTAADVRGVTAVIILLVVGTSVWVGFDARARDWSDNSFADAPWKWVVGSLLLWIVVFPLYLAKRGAAGGALTSPTPQQPVASTPTAFAGWTPEQLAAVRHSPKAPSQTPSQTRSFHLERSGSVPGWVWVTLVAVVVLGFIWNTGALDHTLYHVGLQRHDCYQNGFGAVFCGDEAKQYQDHLRDAGFTP
jgi:hypothetical protein